MKQAFGLVLQQERVEVMRHEFHEFTQRDLRRNHKPKRRLTTEYTEYAEGKVVKNRAKG